LCSNAIKPVSSLASLQTLNNCRLSYEVLNIRFPWLDHRYISQPIFWK
jgi:hypothetical protein